ncbi:hypothetical protein Pcinc_003588 [Petrolisthes cinctipes]|uniref:Uncharacterized protein n=1 Tax=Petrolisthes cinctipes TaxID=88211 RepID=A0AAE1L2E6_PETCI|nr:hypothetical protein Pcinc_003588 [Petrolisthes cinctipes]
MASLFLYMGMCMYAPSLALSTVTNLSTVASIAIMGVVCTFYITIGGVKAVVYTDVLQTLIMLAGTVVVTVLCCYDLGGVGEVWTIADQGQRLQFFNLDPSPFVRHTFWSTIVLGFYNTLAVVGLGQAAFQRLASVSHLSTAVSSLSSTGNSIACLLWEDFLRPHPYFTALSDTNATQVIKLLCQ